VTSLNLPNFIEVSGSESLYSYKNQVDLFPEGKRNPGGVIDMHHTIVKTDDKNEPEEINNFK
jgi:hypothetical protein